MNFDHKHRHIHTRLVVNVLIVAILVVFMGVFLVFQCISFDENGAHVIDRYGVLAMEEQKKQEAALQGNTKAPASETQKEKSENAFRVIKVSAAELQEQDVLADIKQLKKKGTLDAVIVNIKSADGTLNLPVKTRQLEDADLITEDYADDVEDALKELKKAGVYLIGQISCMHDQLAAGQNFELTMQYTNGGSWLDYDNTRWLDITNKSTVRYISDIAKNAVDAGCDEILLDQFTLPLRGHLDRINFARQPETQVDAMLTAWEQLQERLEDTPISLTAGSLTELTELSETGAASGIEVGDLSALFAAAYRIYVPVQDEEGAQAAEAAIHEILDDTAVIPMMRSIVDWQDYTGSAVLNAISDTQGALAVVQGKMSLDDLIEQETEEETVPEDQDMDDEDEDEISQPEDTDNDMDEDADIDPDTDIDTEE